MLLPLLAFLTAAACFGASLFAPTPPAFPLLSHLVWTAGALFLWIALRLTARLINRFEAYLDGGLLCVDALRYVVCRPECRLPVYALTSLLPYSLRKPQARSLPPAFYRYNNGLFAKKAVVLELDDGGDRLALLIEPSPALLRELETLLRHRTAL